MDQTKPPEVSKSKRLLRIILRVAAIIVGLYILLLVGLSIYISSSQERLIGFLNTKMKETILGELKVNKADITIWRSFPDIGITLNNVTISDSFYHRPFLKAGEITVRAGFLGLIGNKVEVSSVKIKDAFIHTFTDAKGYSNTYVLKSQNKPKRQSKKPVVLSNIDLDNVTVLIENVPQNKRFQARIDDAEIDMSLTGSKYKISFDEDMFIRGLGFNMARGYWFEKQRVQADWKLEFDTSGSVLSIAETKVKIQGQPFLIKGEFDLGAKSQFNLNAVTKGINYKSALTILKPNTRSKLQKIDLSAPVDANVTIKGSLSKKGDPAVNVDFKTEKSNLITPVINLNESSFTGNFNNQINPNIAPDDSNSRVSLSSFVSSWGEIELKGQNIAITNLTTPTIKFEFFSECTFPQLDDALSSSTLNFVEGSAKLYLAYNGPLIADPSLINRLNAKILLQHGKVIYVPRNVTLSECNGTVILVGNSLAMNNFQFDLNTNHFTINIDGKNLNRYSSNTPGKATLNCTIASPEIDLADFKTLFAKKNKVVVKKKTANLGGTISSVDNAVENGDVFFGLTAKKVSLNKFTASNVTANLLFQNNDWEVQKAYLQHADGSFNLTAKVHQVSDDYHQASIQTNLQHINVKKLFYAFDNFGQTGITANNLQGTMQSTSNITVGINSAGKLVTNTLDGQLFFSIKNAALLNFDPLLDVQKYVFKKRDLNNVQFAELRDTFDIKKGDIYIRRMAILSSAITMYIDGVYSFGNNTDISIQVPLSTLTSGQENEYKKKGKRTAKGGASIYLRAKDNGGKVKVGLDLFRKFRKNKDDKESADSTK